MNIKEKEVRVFIYYNILKYDSNLNTNGLYIG
jgi:hypothetical protein